MSNTVANLIIACEREISKLHKLLFRCPSKSCYTQYTPVSEQLLCLVKLVLYFIVICLSTSSIYIVCLVSFVSIFLELYLLKVSPSCTPIGLYWTTVRRMTCMPAMESCLITKARDEVNHAVFVVYAENCCPLQWWKWLGWDVFDVLYIIVTYIDVQISRSFIHPLEKGSLLPCAIDHAASWSSGVENPNCSFHLISSSNVS